MFRPIVFALGALLAVPSYAQLASLADAPLASGGLSVVRPNIVMLMDDSGSMHFQFTPDYVAHKDVTIARLCDRGVISSTGTTPADRLASVSSPCPEFSYTMMRDGLGPGYSVLAPLPPAYSPDINQQYYTPEVQYQPPVKADLTSYPSMDGTSTTRGGAAGASAGARNWRSVPQDGYSIYTTNKFNVEVWPISYYCDQQATPVCAAETGYNFPELNTVAAGLTAKRTRIEPKKTGTFTAVQAQAFGAPNYYRLGISEYCKEEQLINCVKSTVPTGTYVFPARVRFCKDIDKLVCQKNFNEASGYMTPSYIHVPGAGVPAASAQATLNVKTLTNPGTGGQVTSLKIGNVDVGGFAMNQTGPIGLATAIAAKLNTIPGFTATASGANVVIKNNVATEGTLYNGTPVYIESTPGVTTGVKYQFTVGNGYNIYMTAQNWLTTLNVGGVNIAGPAIINKTGTGYAAFAPAAVINWATKGGTNGFTATAAPVSGYPNSMLVTMTKNVADYAPADETNTMTVGFTQSAGGTKVTAYMTNTIRPVTTSATFSFDGGIIAASASGVLNGGVAENVTPMNRGPWTRTSIESGKLYPRAASRNDCAGLNCTYIEEMTNFANWFAYYRFRANMAKTATGLAFSQLNDNYRVGYTTINATNVQLGVKPFDATDTSATSHRRAWYTRLYNQSATGGTPLRIGLGMVGRYYAGKHTSSPDPMEYSCQKNYTILVTDGYWTATAGKDLNNADINGSLDSDATDANSTRISGVYDGRNAGGTLADVAQYYYVTDLRTTGTLAKNNVPTNTRDPNNAQHMNTYTMGLGIDGLMTYRKDYAAAATGDFARIRYGQTGCAWEASMTTVCNWPVPVANSPTAVDDLWHAAVNGRGQYFSARTPQETADGLKQALADVTASSGSAAASATSSPNITQTSNLIYSSTYQSSVWDGDVVAQRIDLLTGAVLAAPAWKASDLLNAQANSLTDNENARTLLTLDINATGDDKGKPFKFSSLLPAETAWFTGRCTSSQLGQCAENLVPFERRAYIDNAEHMVNFLRGHNDPFPFIANDQAFGYLDIFRPNRLNRLGDTVNAVPLFLSKPNYTFDFDVPVGHESYPQFIQRVYPECESLDTTCESAPPPRRPDTLFMAANDGMLHAFDGETGIERFAYIPRATMPEMWRLADFNYSTRHRYFVDGSPVTMDISTSDNVWKTILVGGFRSGGSGFYALDVTNPKAPKVLWETCNSAALCTNVVPDMGLSFGNPVITRMPLAHPTLGGKWVVLVTSGYNNVPSVVTQPTANAVASTSTGKGFLFVLDPESGALLKTYATNEGTVAAPVNLGKLSSFAPNFYFDGISNVAYSGDLQGNVWRFNLAKEPAEAGAVYKLAALKRDGKVQPITTKIELGILPNSVDPILFVATGQFLGVGDLTNNEPQSLYAMRDQYSTASPPTTNNLYGSPRDYVVKPFVKQVISDDATLGIRKMTNNTVDWNSKSGWYVDFPDTGERVTLDPALVLGTLTVSSNVVNSATADACEVGGYSWLYQLDYTSGSKVPTAPTDAIAHKVPSALIVGTVIVRLPSGALKTITTTAAGAKVPYDMYVNSANMAGRRLSWRELPQ